MIPGVDPARLLEQAVAAVTAQALLVFTLKATLVLAGAWLVARLVREKSAALRHAVWTSAVACVLVLPALGVAVPRLSVGILPDWDGETLARDAAPMGPTANRADDPRRGTDPRLRRGGDEEGAEPGAALRSADDRTGPGDPLFQPTGAAPEGAVEEAFEAPDGAVVTLPPADGLLLAGWLGGALVVLGLLALEGWWLARLRRRGRMAAPSEIEPTVSDAARRLGLRSVPPIHVCRDLEEPVASGALRPRVMLPAGFSAWPSSRRESVLLHELAHVRRRDVAWQTAASLLCAVQWFNPLAWLAARRMREERERACDDEVLRAGASPVRYASALVALAREAGVRRPRPTAATSMAADRGLSGRIEAVLEPELPRPRATRLLACGLGAVGLAVALPVAALSVSPDESVANRVSPATPSVEPRVAGPGAWERDPAHGASARAAAGAGVELVRQETPFCWRGDRAHRSSVNIREEERTYRVRRRTEGCTGTIHVRGEIGFDAEYSRIVRLSPDALVEIEERRDGGVTRLSGTADDDGRPVVWRWRVDGEERPFDADARAWLRARVPVVLRFTGIQARGRAAWLYERGGIEGLVDEIPRLRGDATRRRYLEAHVGSTFLSADELDDVLTSAADVLGSDHEMRRLLVSVAEALPDALSSGPASEAFWRAVRTVGSDGEQRRLLDRLAEILGPEPERLVRLLESAADGIGSDGEMAGFLVRTVRRYPASIDDEPVRTALAEAAATVGSDGERRRVERALERVRGI